MEDFVNRLWILGRKSCANLTGERNQIHILGIYTSSLKHRLDRFDGNPGMIFGIDSSFFDTDKQRLPVTHQAHAGVMSIVDPKYDHTTAFSKDRRSPVANISRTSQESVEQFGPS